MMKEQTDFKITITKKHGVITVKGDTVKIKDMLKNHGFKWDKDQKVWKKSSEDGIDITEKTIEFLEKE